MNIDQYLGMFIDESRDNLQRLNECLLELELNASNIELLHEIFRIIHTVKGMSGSMGYENLQELTHYMENVLDLMRNAKFTADADTLDLLFKCLDKLETLVNAVIENGKDAGDVDELVVELKKISDMVESNTNTNGDDAESTVNKAFEFNEYEKSVLNEAKSQQNKILSVKIVLDAECILPAVRAFMVERALEPLGEIIKTIPDTEELENGEFDGSFKLCYITKVEMETVKLAILDISEIESVELVDITDTYTANDAEKPEAKTPKKTTRKKTSGSKAKATAKSTEEKKEPPKEPDNKSDELSVAEQIILDLNKQIDKAKTNDTPAAAQKGMNPNKIPQTIRVASDRLDKLMNLVGELVINRTRVDQVTIDKEYNALPNAINTMGRVIGDIQEIVMKLRMVPIENVFNRFPRLVRDITKDMGKSVNLVMKGQDTELDRVVVEEMGDPLVHLIRNSLDHGFETIEERKKAGKSETGTLELNAFNEGDNIVIKVIDDGRGINKEIIKKKAVEKGLMSAETFEKLSDREIYDIIFMPGFSTKEKATDLSGRGVGMDVVKTSITNLGGSVYVESEQGKGTTITITLPSTIAIIQALLVKVGLETYAVPLNNVNEVIDITRDQISTVQGKEVIMLRGHVLPLVRMDTMLDVETSDKDNEEVTVMVVKSSGREFGAVVTSLIGQQEVVIKPINKNLCAKNFFSGATTLGNGQVSLIVNVNNLFGN